MLVSGVAALAAALLATPAFALLVLTLAAGRRPPAASPVPERGPRVRVAILVPAHNESANVLPTIACLLPQLGASDRLLVVADNCTDDTAALARGAGATVVERSDAQRRGKGYALAFGVDHLRPDPPDVVLVVDADCTVTPGAVARIGTLAAQLDRPVQMLNLMHAAPGASVRLRTLEFAMVVKNFVRPYGASRLGGACHLMGTGMALPWAQIADAELATGHIAEDMKLGIELAVAGHAPLFSLDAEVSSAFPQDDSAARAQKSRWEHGHLALLTAELPRMLRAAFRSGRPALWVMALDLLIPPLALYALTLSTALLVTIALALAWPSFAAGAMALGAGACAFAVAVLLAWSRFGRHLLGARELLMAPLYAVWKVPVYVAYALRRRSGWVRARRKTE